MCGSIFRGQRLAFVYEARPTGFGLYDELVAAGHPCLVVAPPMVPRAARERVKTNRLDSRKLSTGLRGGDLKSIHVPAPKYRELRHLVQLRDTHVGQLTATKCRIKALLLYEGIAFPSDEGKAKQWSARVLDELLELPCSETVRFKLDQLIGTLHFNFNAAAAAQKQIRYYCKKDAELRQSIAWLKSLPGIGEIVATHLVARLGDPALITNVARHVRTYKSRDIVRNELLRKFGDELFANQNRVRHRSMKLGGFFREHKESLKIISQTFDIKIDLLD